MKKTFYNKIVIGFLAIALSVTMFPVGQFFVSAETVEEKIYSNATIEDEFVDNKVTVILNTEASFSDKDYTVSDFSEIECINVTNLTTEATAVARGEKTNELVNTENFKRILSIELQEHSKQNVLDAIDELIQRDDVIYAGPDYLMEMASSTSNDTRVGEQWALDYLDVPEAWDFTTGNQIVVGILDSGIDDDNPDIPQTDELLKQSYTTDDPIYARTTKDYLGHGTAVAGIIGATAWNNEGIAGVNRNVLLADLRVLKYNNQTTVSIVTSAIDWASSKGIKILNFSIGFPSNWENLTDLYYKIANYNGLFVCCAGNDNLNISETNSVFPAVYNLDNLITVGALNSVGERWNDESINQGSNYGADTVDIYAPGADILTTNNTTCMEADRNWYRLKSGTSFATPYVTGVASLLLSMKPNLTPAQLKEAILNSAVTGTITIPNDTTEDPNDTTTQTVKKLNAFNAVKYLLNTYLIPNTLTVSSEASFSKTLGYESGYLTYNTQVKLDILNEGVHTFSITANEAYSVYLYDSNWNKIDITTTSTQNGYQVDFSENLSVGQYFLRVYVPEYWDDVNINIDIESPYHIHNYTGWKYYDRSSHIQLCDCGETGTVTQAHAVLPKDRDKPFAYCIGCGNLLDLRFDLGEHPGIESLTRKVTLNGSYTLPSGIIVLVEEDIEAYMNNTLVFYDEDDLPQTA